MVAKRVTVRTGPIMPLKICIQDGKNVLVIKIIDHRAYTAFDPQYIGQP